jgi:hypothetical protein
VVTFIPSPFTPPDPPAGYRWPKREPTIPTPPMPTDRAALRHRRRSGLRVHYTSRFDLSREVEDICGPLATAIAGMLNPVVMGGRVGELFDACHELAVTVVDLIVTAAAAANGSRSATAQMLADLAAKPAPPEVDDTMLVDGSWSQVLTGYVAPLSADLARVLGRALPPGDERLKGRLSASERLTNALLGLDEVAVPLARSVEVTDRHQRQPSLAQRQEQQRRERGEQARQKRLARLGVTIERTST